MWIMYRGGFISIVKKGKHGGFAIRARDRQSLEQLFAADRIVAYTGTDYPFRVLAGVEETVDVIAKLTSEIDYSNFKDELKRKRGKRWASVAGQVWSALFSLEPKSVKRHYAKNAGAWLDPFRAEYSNTTNPHYSTARQSASAFFAELDGDEDAAEAYAMAGGQDSFHRLTDDEWTELEKHGIMPDDPPF